MNISEIEKLLDKYYEGLTTLSEEKYLKEFFLSEAVPPHLQIHSLHFKYFANASTEEINDPFFEEKFHGKVNESQILHVRSNRNLFYYVSGIAAGILLLIGLFFTFRNDVVKRSETDAPGSNPQIVFQQTQDILMFVSMNFNKGIDEMHNLGQFDKAIQKVQMISKFYQYQNLIINPDPIEKKSTNPEKQ